MGVQLLRDAGAGQRGAADRLRKRLPRRGSDVTALLLSVGDAHAREVDRVLRDHRPTGPPSCRSTDWFAIADDPSSSYADKLAGYQALADRYFDKDHYDDFCASALPHIDEMVLSWVGSEEFDALLVSTVEATYPEHEVEMFLAHFRGLLDLWLNDQQAIRGPEE